MGGRCDRSASRASLIFMKSSNTPVVVATPSGALKQLNLRKQKIAVALVVGGSEKPPSHIAAVFSCDAPLAYVCVLMET
jgi:hypothetical protein